MRLLLLSLLLACPAAMAQRGEPQLVWEGEVDGTTVVRFHGDRVDTEPLRGLPVQRQRFRYHERLPQVRQNVRLEVVEGRGNVRIIEQPRPENGYMLAVRIDDSRGGTAFYSLAFFWDRDDGRRDTRDRPEEVPRRLPISGGTESLRWSGRVDGEAVISCGGDACTADERSGRPVTRDRYRFTRRMPRRDFDVSLIDTEGRGEIRLLEQPSPSNGYTARVRIRDSHGGASDYAFTLAWNPPTRSQGFDVDRPGMTWSGRVDGRVRVSVRGRDAEVRILSGQPVIRERAQFSRALPARNTPNATVRRAEGRGRVAIIEYPSARNGYTLVFEIDDRDGGADDYVVEVGW